jgi:site-specific DNA-cytosine methylase
MQYAYEANLTAHGIAKAPRADRAAGRPFCRPSSRPSGGTTLLQVLENVSGLVKLNNGSYIATVLKSLEQLGGYNISYQILDTKQNGVPHSRRRVYIVGIHQDADRGSFTFPEPIPAHSDSSTARSRIPAKPAQGGNAQCSMVVHCHRPPPALSSNVRQTGTQSPTSGFQC